MTSVRSSCTNSTSNKIRLHTCQLRFSGILIAALGPFLILLQYGVPLCPRWDLLEVDTTNTEYMQGFLSVLQAQERKWMLSTASLMCPLSLA